MDAQVLLHVLINLSGIIYESHGVIRFVPGFPSSARVRGSSPRDFEKGTKYLERTIRHGSFIKHLTIHVWRRDETEEDVNGVARCGRREPFRGSEGKGKEMLHSGGVCVCGEHFMSFVPPSSRRFLIRPSPPGPASATASAANDVDEEVPDGDEDLR